MKCTFTQKRSRNEWKSIEMKVNVANPDDKRNEMK
jgi:hypothetical protein